MKPYHFFILILVFACQKDKQAPANNASETFPVPIIWIDTQSVPIDSKEDYVDATIVIEGGDPNHGVPEAVRCKVAALARVGIPSAVVRALWPAIRVVGVVSISAVHFYYY